MIATMLIAGVALVLAIGIGALIEPSEHASTTNDWAWEHLPASPRP
jgi:hypothetical protein